MTHSPNQPRLDQTKLDQTTLNQASLHDAALAVLLEPDPAAKVAKSRQAADDWRAGRLVRGDDARAVDASAADTNAANAPAPPDRPARPERPALAHPKDLPKRSFGGEAGRRALLHALAHIELNAIDLAWDMIARFDTDSLPRAFADDWVTVGVEEAEHFVLLVDRLGELGGAYGDLAAHDGLWEAAAKTSDDILARLALVPMVLEARGLDTTPTGIARLRANNDPASADIIEKIATDEISHVAAGVRWFEYVCGERGLNPVATFQGVVRERFNGPLKPPFNRESRDKAGMRAQYTDME